MPITMSRPIASGSQPGGDDARWAALCARARSADGAFVYAVVTTGVYCRPSCPSRRPRRENVSFHPDPAAAEAAGYRPCKRCRPHEASGEARLAARMAAICRHIEQAETPPRLDELAARAGLSRYHFHRSFKAAVGVTPRAYAEAVRRARMQTELDGDASVTDALYRAGFNSHGRFYAATDAALGMTPSEYRAGGAGNTIRFAVGECSLGAVLVACSGRGVCAIALGDDPEALVHELQDRFPSAELIGGDAGFEATVARVVALVEEPAQGHDLPLDLRGTAFQQRVWAALRRIPCGETMSYQELARAIGRPGAARAVARACACNPVAVAVPCHRVVRTDGSLSGYRWGVERKRRLLEREIQA